MKDSICHKDISIKEALSFINNEPAGIAFITDVDSKLIGLITDGDIRRLLIDGRKLDSFLKKEDYNNYVFAREVSPLKSS